MASPPCGAPSPPATVQLAGPPDRGQITPSGGTGDEKHFSDEDWLMLDEDALSDSSDDDEDSESSSGSSGSSGSSWPFDDCKEDVHEASSDTEEEDECPKQPCLDEDLVTDWYSGPLYKQRDQRQCNEYFLRGRSLIRCLRYLHRGHALTLRHSRRLLCTLFAGKHNSLEHRNKNNSEYIKRAKAEYEALLEILHRQDGVVMSHYLLAALVTVQKCHMLVLHVRLMEVTLLLLREENTGVQNLSTVVSLCGQLEYNDLQRFVQRPPAEVMVGVVHSLLHRVTHTDLHAILHTHHKCIYHLACAPVLGPLGYHGTLPHCDTAVLYNNSAKIFHDYLGHEAHLLLLVALHANLLSPNLGLLSDLLLDRVARAARHSPMPPNMLGRLEYHLHVTDSRPGPRGCVALLRLLRRCHRQVRQLQDFPGLLQRLVSLLVSLNDRPMTVARDLGRLLFLLREERPALLQGMMQAGKAAIKDRLSGSLGVGIQEVSAHHFLVNLVRLVVAAARVVALPPVTYSDSESDEETDEPDEAEIPMPATREVAAVLLGLCGRQAEPRASWSELASEVSHLVLSADSGPRDCHVMDAVLQLAVSLEDADHDLPRHDRQVNDDDQINDYIHSSQEPAGC
ncbi:hypothetical protein E2C01_060801 [Portunus trituberculatus]|uniref:Uncharacterized protein n=1 Tax=Portunus trituberculatus TaxID=210409 RepID=A0A5B7H273_PORTR|nr:hypothetical protein [Portunus trituberculatus]